MTEERDLGPQPLETILAGWGLSNHDLVEVSPEQLTHKQVQKAAKGRKLTLKMKQKLARSINFAVWGRLKDEFSAENRANEKRMDFKKCGRSFRNREAPVGFLGKGKAGHQR